MEHTTNKKQFSNSNNSPLLQNKEECIMTICRFIFVKQ